jgi:hypothetical protein
MEDSIRKKEQWVKIDLDRKSSPCIEKDCFKKSHNYCSTGGSRTEYRAIQNEWYKKKT